MKDAKYYAKLRIELAKKIKSLNEKKRDLRVLESKISALEREIGFIENELKNQ